MAALQIKNIPTGPGDDIKMDASFTRGDTKNVIATTGTSPNFAMFGSSGVAYQSVGFGATTDAVWLPAINGGTGDLKLTTAYGFRGAFNQNWDPYWSSSLFGSRSAVRYNGSSTDITTAKGQYCANYILNNKLTALNTSANFSCNPDFNVSQLGVITRWTPVANLTFSAEAMWTHLDQKFTGTAVLTPTAPKPTATYEFKNQDNVELELRVQRNF
jgi:Porin subfamily